MTIEADDSKIVLRVKCVDRRGLIEEYYREECNWSANRTLSASVMLHCRDVMPMNRKLRLRRSLRRGASIILVLVGMSCLVGCDPVRRTIQNITLTVKDGQSRPIADVEVKAKESWESWQSWTPEEFNDGDQAHYRARWESDFVPWLQGRTDAQGEAILKLDQTGLDGSKGGTPPPERDQVSNREYIVRLRNKDEEDEVRLLMKPGQESRGARYSIRVDAIESPVYVPVKQ